VPNKGPIDIDISKRLSSTIATNIVISKNVIATKPTKEIAIPTNKGAKYTSNSIKTKGPPTKTPSLG